MLVFSLVVSLSFLFGKAVASDIDPGALMALRFLISTLVLWAVVRATGAEIVLVRFWRFLLIGGCMAAYFVTMFEALRLTTAVSASAVFTLTPLLAAGFGLAILGQRTGLWVLSALLVGAAGAIWVIFRADLAALLRFEIGTGEAIFLVGVLAHGAVPALLGRLLPDVTPLQSSFSTSLGALLATTIYAAPALWDTSLAELPARVWWVLAYLAVVTTAGTFFLLQYASKRLPGTKVMAYTYLVPSWVVIWEVIALARWPATALLAGIALTFLALVMLLRDEAPG